jgi:hypothetical protein|nr:MAG TPA: adenylate kinase [Caudoviricetes sp.]
MISDKKRREVADKMRGYDVAEFKESAIVPFLECLGHGYTNWRGILDELADLIDRPTCHLVKDEDGRTICSECEGTALGKLDAVYCPECGAEVVRDGD